MVGACGLKCSVLSMRSSVTVSTMTGSLVGGGCTILGSTLELSIVGGSRNKTGVTNRWNVSTGNGFVSISAIFIVLGMWANRTICAAIASRTRW